MFLHPGGLAEASQLAKRTAGIPIPASVEEAEALTISDEWHDAEVIVVPSLNVVVSSADAERVARLRSVSRSPIRKIRPEYEFRIAQEATDYLRGFRDGVNAVVAGALAGQREAPPGFDVFDEPGLRDDDQLTWGLQAIGIDVAARSGKGRSRRFAGHWL
jgi:hypothetical protein